MKVTYKIIFSVGICSALLLSSCATIVNDPNIPLAVSFSDGSAGSCTFKNKRGVWASDIPTVGILIRRSDDALIYDCQTKDGREVTGTIESEIEGGKIAASVLFWDLGITDSITDKHRTYQGNIVIPIQPKDQTAGESHSSGETKKSSLVEDQTSQPMNAKSAFDPGELASTKKGSADQHIERLTDEALERCLTLDKGGYAEPCDRDNIRQQVLKDQKWLQTLRGQTDANFAEIEKRPMDPDEQMSKEPKAPLSSATQSATEAQPQHQTDLYSELIKLKELQDKGILTQEEFDQQKAKLLNQ